MTYEKEIPQELPQGEPIKHRTVLIAAFEGWNDACQVASSTARHIVDVYSEQSHEAGHICCSTYYDYQQTRPVICTVEGKRQIMWPQMSFYAIGVNPHLTLIVEVGPEPNFKWMEFAQRSLRIADEYEVDEVIVLGSMFADATHTRPLPVYKGDSNEAPSTDDYTGPIGIPTVLNFVAGEQGYKSHSMWVSLPQYMGMEESPLGVQTLLQELSKELDVEIPLGDVKTRADKWIASANALMTYNDELAQYIHNVENEYDKKEETRKFADVISHEKSIISDDLGSALINETEEFLKSFSSSSSDDSDYDSKE